MNTAPYHLAFSSTLDTSCSVPVDHAEFSRLVSQLDAMVLPIFWQAVHQLYPLGFKAVRVSRQGGLASLLVQRQEPEADAWLYFQIHRSFGPSLTRECVFWMYAIHHPAGTTASRPGRLQHLDDPLQVEEITAGFIHACGEVPHRFAVSA